MRPLELDNNNWKWNKMVQNATLLSGFHRPGILRQAPCRREPMSGTDDFKKEPPREREVTV